MKYKIGDKVKVNNRFMAKIVAFSNLKGIDEYYLKAKDDEIRYCVLASSLDLIGHRYKWIKL